MVTNFFRTWTFTFVILKIEKHIDLEEKTGRRKNQGENSEFQKIQQR